MPRLTVTRRQALGKLAFAFVPAWELAESSANSDERNSGLPFDLELLPQTNKLVIAHWHYFPISFDNREADVDYYATQFLRAEGEGGRYAFCGGLIRERPLPRQRLQEPDWQVRDMVTDILLASKIGIDVFQYNLSALDPGSIHWLRLLHLLEAARATSVKFYIMPCVDCVSVTSDKIDRLPGSLQEIMDHESLHRDKSGRPVISMFLPERIGVDAMSRTVAEIKKRWPIVRFYFIFLSWTDALMRPDLLNLAEDISIWSGDHEEALNTLDSTALSVRSLGKNWVAPIWPQDFRPKSRSFVESRNSELFRTAWQRAIEGNQSSINILTWNDYSEGSEIRPSTSILYSFYDLAAFYIHWFKSGSQPRLVRDALYYFHRVNIVGQTTLALQDRPFNQPYGPRVANDVEVVAFLTSPATIKIITGDRTTVFDAPTGISAHRTAAQPGRPQFAVTRDDEEIISFHSLYEILSNTNFEDLLYHGGSSGRVTTPY